MAAESAGMRKKIKGFYGCTDEHSGTAGNCGENLTASTKSPGRWSNSKRRMVFQLGTKKSLESGRVLLQERVSLFHGKTNHVRCLSVNDLNTHLHEWTPCNQSYAEFRYHSYQCVWEGRPVLVKFNGLSDRVSNGRLMGELCREIAIATEMGIHKNVHKLLACCLETEIPVLIYEYLQNGPLSASISYTSEALTQLEWKDRLRIASEISHALAFLHTRFPRLIIHRNLTPQHVLLDENNAAKLTDFSLCVSIPKGKTCLEHECVIGTYGYVAPAYIGGGRIVEKSDVFSFGVLFIELLTGQRLRDWAPEISGDPFKYNVAYPDVIKRVNAYNNVAAAASQTLDEEEEEEEEEEEDVVRKQLLQESTELALRCIAVEEDSRPTMEEVATQLKNIITYPASFNSSLPQPPPLVLHTPN